MTAGKTDRILGTEKVATTDGTWAQCTRKGKLLFISGQISLDARGDLVGKDNFEKQAVQALDNLAGMLEVAGAGLADLMMITVFVTDMDNRPIFARVRSKYLKENPPASTIVEIKRLCMDELLIEVNGIALLD